MTSAEFLLSSWEGAILRMKVERNAEPLERFKRIVFVTVFKEPSPMNDVSLPKLSVLNSEMAYREAGSRDAPVALFLHGNPTSSYIWRKLSRSSRRSPIASRPTSSASVCRASPTSPIASRTTRAISTPSSQKWESAPPISWRRTGEAVSPFTSPSDGPISCAGLAFMEFIRPIPTWEEFLRGSQAREIFRKFRTPGEGEKLILEDNAFVERVLPGGMRHKLTRRRDGGLSRAVPDA